MAEPDERAERTLAVAEKLVAILGEAGIGTALIGAAALAAHGYPRETADLDLATHEDPFTTLTSLTKKLVEAGFAAELVTPDEDDPLGGVINIEGADHDPVQLVNYRNPLGGPPNPGKEAIATATSLPGVKLRVVDVPHLVALKLYAGGRKSELDVLELLERNPTVPLAGVRAICAKYRLADALDAILARR